MDNQVDKLRVSIATLKDYIKLTVFPTQQAARNTFYSLIEQQSNVATSSKSKTCQFKAPEKVGKNNRKSFDVNQLISLEYHYIQHKYLIGSTRLRLAKHLNLTEAQVKVWFQNRRAKDNRVKNLSLEEKKGVAKGSIVPHSSSSTSKQAMKVQEYLQTNSHSLSNAIFK